MIYVYNTLSREKEVFKPITAGKINMYVCGPTVYNYIHIGNARSAIAFDTVRRYFEYRGYEVNYVSNFTDVDDKIINRAQEEGISELEVANKYADAFDEDTLPLNIKPATVRSRATEVIPEIIEFVKDLIDKGYAYESEGDVYFRAKKFKGYGILAHQDLAEMEANAAGRLNDEETIRKEDPIDFAVWKNDPREGVISRSSPGGNGRPGWHIECSVMSTSLLGETIDIHGGGADLEFPHHTNEIAQSEAKTGQKFVNYWMHNGFVNVDGEKMSKSLGNFTTVHELLQVVNPQILRFFLATTHYRRPVNFTDDALTEAENNIKKIENAYRHLDEQAESNLSALTTFRNDFVAAMDEDFNIANGMTVFYDFVSWVNKGNGGPEVKEFFDQVLEILGIKFKFEQSLDSEIEAMIEARQLAREVRDFAKSDEIRDALKAQGIVLEDTKDGVRWHRE